MQGSVGAPGTPFFGLGKDLRWTRPAQGLAETVITVGKSIGPGEGAQGYILSGPLAYAGQFAQLMQDGLDAATGTEKQISTGHRPGESNECSGPRPNDTKLSNLTDRSAGDPLRGGKEVRQTGDRCREL